jgi:hypothetical protein
LLKDFKERVVLACLVISKSLIEKMTDHCRYYPREESAKEVILYLGIAVNAIYPKIPDISSPYTLEEEVIIQEMTKWEKKMNKWYRHNRYKYSL